MKIAMLFFQFQKHVNNKNMTSASGPHRANLHLELDVVIEQLPLPQHGVLEHSARLGGHRKSRLELPPHQLGDGRVSLTLKVPAALLVGREKTRF